MANVFTGAIAIAGLLIALATYKVAKEALTTWKEQKNHEYEVIIHSNLKTLMNLIKETYSLNTEYTSVNIHHSKEFRDSTLIYPDIEKAHTLKSALTLIRMYDLQKKKNNNEIKSLLSTINSAVVGIKNPVLSNLFYDIKDLLDNLDRIHLDLVSWNEYFKDTLQNNLISGKVKDIVDYRYFEIQFKDFFLGSPWEKEILELDKKVGNYLRGKI